MIDVYFENENQEKVKVFMVINEGGHTGAITVGNQAVSKQAGIQFYVDEIVSLQMFKMDLYMEGLVPKLKLKEGEELELDPEAILD